jgi:hypothetical protein
MYVLVVTMAAVAYAKRYGESHLDPTYAAGGEQHINGVIREIENGRWELLI